MRAIGKYIMTGRKITLANGLINSIIVYCIQLWGINASKKLHRQVQALQGQAARWALGLNRRASTKKVLDKMNWMSVNQLVIYHSTLLLWKIVRGKDSKLERTEWESSRTQGHHRIRTAPYKKEFRRKAWKPAAIAWWNAMPESLRADCSPSSFKWNLRSWVRGNIDLRK